MENKYDSFTLYWWKSLLNIKWTCSCNTENNYIDDFGSSTKCCFQLWILTCFAPCHTLCLVNSSNKFNISKDSWNNSSNHRKYNFAKRWCKDINCLMWYYIFTPDFIIQNEDISQKITTYLSFILITIPFYPL